MKIQGKYKIAMLLALLGAILLLVPVNQQRIISTGTDVFEAHHALYGKRVKSQEVTLRGKLAGVAGILVNLRHVPELTPVHILIRSTDSTVLAEQVVDPANIKDDSYAWVEFNPLRVPNNQVRIEFSAPEATNETAIGLRFEENRPEQLAVAVKERTPLGQAVTQFTYDLVTKTDHGPAILWGLAATMLLTLIFLIPHTPLSSHFKSNAYAYCLLIIFFLTIAIRVDVLRAVSYTHLTLPTN